MAEKPIATTINRAMSPIEGSKLLNLFLHEKIGRTNAIRTMFLINVCTFVIFNASPKQPQSGTILYTASKNVRMVKNIIMGSRSQAVFLIQRLKRRLMPSKNSRVERKIVRMRLKLMNQGMLKAIK